MIRSLIGKKFPFSRLALTLGVGSSLLAMGNASAQVVSNPTTSQAPETAEADRVIVTGSNIPTSEEVGEAAVDTIDQATRDRTGQEDVLGVLTRANPAISSGGGNLGQSNASISSAGTYGGSSINIHGLPTLVLLNGRRLTDASAAAAGGNTFTDVNLFPSALVKRIEVLKDGASAIYGSEAIGGVVNVILDQQFTGFEFSTRYGFTQKSDIQDKRYSGIAGISDDKTNIVLGVEYNEQDPIFNRQRRFAGPAFGTTNFAGSVTFQTVPGITSASSSQRYLLAPGIITPNLGVPTGSIPLPGGAAGTGAGAAGFPAGTFIPATTTQVLNSFDLSKATSITLDQNRLNFYGSFDRKLIDNHLVAFGDVLYTKNYSQSYLNAQPVSTATGVVIPQGAPFNPFDGDVNGVATSGVAVANRFTANPRTFRNDTDFFRVVAGFKGEIIKNYNYEIALNSSQDELTFKNEGLVIATNLNNAIAGGYNADGTTAPAVITGGHVVTPAGPFSSLDGGATVQPALDFFSRNNPAAATKGVFGDNIRYLLTRQYGLDGKITAFPFNLPAGPVGFAAGGEYRHEKFRLQDSPEIFIGSTPIADINVGHDVTSGFAEVRIPVVSPEMKIPGVYSFDVDAAGRYETFSDVGDNLVPKVGLTFRPIKDVALRATYSQSFIAPTLYQTSGPNSQGFTNAIDLGAGPEQAQSFGGSNPNLKPSTADTYTAGIVISPHQVEGLNINLDFFHVEQKDLIGNINSNAILSSVNSSGTASPFFNQVALNNFPGRAGATPVTGPGQLVGNLDNVYIINNTTNFGGQRVGGVDFGVHYNHDFGVFGGLNIGIDGTYFLQYKTSTATSGKFYDIIGYYTGQTGYVEPYHLTPSVEYRWNGFTASALGNYIPGGRDAQLFIDPTPGFGGTNPDKATSLLANTGSNHLNKIRDYYTIDLLFAYEFKYKAPNAPVPAPKDAKDAKGGGKSMVSNDINKSMASDMALKLLDGLKVSFGINNVTNALPPRFADSPDSTNTDASIYDPYQRQFYFVISKKF